VSSVLSCKLGPLELKNPLLAASGTFGYGLDYLPIVRPDQFGAVVLKGTSPEPWAGNRPPRLCETPSGLLNAIGLENPGVEWVVREALPALRQWDTRIIANVVGRTQEEYIRVVERLTQCRQVDALELNISCPNVKEGGLSFGACPDTAYRLVRACRETTGLPLLVKLSPNVTDIAGMASSVIEAGADIITAINTLSGMEIDVDSGRPVLGNTFGGLSGPAIRPIALRCVWQVWESGGPPIVGVGGIACARDVLAFMMAGAGACAVGTGLFRRPSLVGEILGDLERYVRRRGLDSIGRVVGTAHVNRWEGAEDESQAT